MFEFELTAESAVQVRLACSPLQETVGSLTVLCEPSAPAIHLPWVERVRPRVADLDLRVLSALVSARNYKPDFLAPPPSEPLPTLDQELARVRATPPEQVRRELEIAYPQGIPDLLQPLHAEPRAELMRLELLLRAYWDRALAPHASRMLDLLDSDIVHRAWRFADGGTAALLAELHPTVERVGETLRVRSRCDAIVPLDERGLLLMPSIFAWPRARAIVDPPWQPTLIYPARGAATLWDPVAHSAPGSLAGVLGRTRAALLAQLDVPRSGGELAQRLDLTPGAVSQQLTALRAAGLVVASRHGRAVLSRRTALGDTLVAVGQREG